MIVLDTRWITDTPSGIGVYAREMLARLPRLAPDLRFHALFRAPEHRDAVLAADPALGALPNLGFSILPCGPLSPKSQLALPPLLRRLGARLLHSPNFLVPYTPFLHRCAFVANIHDIIPIVVPDYAPSSRTNRLKAVYRHCLRSTIRRSAATVTGSEATRGDLVRELRLPPALAERIRVIYDGAGESLSADGRAPVKALEDPAPRTLLYVGRMDPYKNVTLLVEALREIRARCPFPVRLRVVGPKDPRYPEAERRAAELGLGDAVEFTGFVSPEALADAYRSADLLTHPSRYEGFGLQLVEAMRAGLPVLCTDGGSQPEVAGDAALVVPRDDAHALAEAASALLQNPARLCALQTRGIARAPLFSWQTAAEKTLALFREVLAQGSAAPPST